MHLQRIHNSLLDAWHDHGNDGSKPVIWLDGLDMPMFAGSFPINFQVRMMDHRDHSGRRYHDSRSVALPAST